MGLLSFVAGGLNSGAQKKEDRLKQQLLDQSAAISRTEFDKRMAALGGSDARTTDLLTGQHNEEGANADQTFAYLLDQAQKGFGEQQQIDSSGFDARYANTNDAFDKEMTAQGDLMTAQKAARVQSAQASEAERQRQLAFQGQADDLARALPGQIGYDAQTAGRQTALGDRSALIKSAMTQVAAPAFAGGDPTVSGAYAAAADRGSNAGLGDALRSADLSSYGDAYQGANRELGGFASDVAGITTKAGISRSALPSELNVGKVQAGNAKDQYDFASGLAKDMGGARDQILADNTTRQGTTASNFRSANTSAENNFSDAFAKMLSDYYGNKIDSEGNYINGLTTSSTDLENKLLNLNNYKLTNTSVTSPLASTLKSIDKAGQKAAAAAGGG